MYEDFSERSFNSLKIITKNTNLIKNYYNSKEKIIFFTSFDRKFRKKIENKLIKLNFSNFEILTNLNLGPSNLITNINKSMISNNLNIIHQTNSIINNA